MRIPNAVLLAGITILAIVGCRSEDAPLFESCPPPCWHDIVPGQTPADEALSILRMLYGQENVDSGAGFVAWETDGGLSGGMALLEGRASTIVLRFPGESLRVETLVAELGAPAIVHVTLPHPRRTTDASRPECEILRLVYLEMAVEVVLYDSLSGQITAEQSIHSLYLAPERPELTILTPFYTREWEGYGNYCISVDDIFD